MNKTERTKKLLAHLFILTVAFLAACSNAATPEPTVTAVISQAGATEEEIHRDNTPESHETGIIISQEMTNTPLPVITKMAQDILVLPTVQPSDSGMIINRSASSDNKVTTYQLPALPATAFPASIEPTATTMVISNNGDKALWEKQSPEDNTHIDAGAEFDITWYLRNTGTTTWTTDYCCRYFSNTNLTKRQGQRFYLQHNVAPNELGECTIDAIAPTTPGTYKMAYVLSSAEDKNFYTVDITIIVD